MSATMRETYAPRRPVPAERYPSGAYRYVDRSGPQHEIEPDWLREMEEAYETIAPHVPDAAAIFQRARAGDSVMRRHLFWLERMRLVAGR